MVKMNWDRARGGDDDFAAVGEGDELQAGWRLRALDALNLDVRAASALCLRRFCAGFALCLSRFCACAAYEPAWSAARPRARPRPIRAL